MLRPLNKIAAEISIITREPSAKKLKARVGPYVEAMLELSDAKGFYGIDPAEEVVLKFLHNATHWRHPRAAAIRQELREHIYNAKESHASH